VIDAEGATPRDPTAGAQGADYAVGLGRTGRSRSGIGTGGIFDGGLEAYRTVTEEEYSSLLTSGLIVLDANVLLNLYRYHAQTRDDLLAVLARLEHRL
jgi:hypothetical protein